MYNFLEEEVATNVDLVQLYNELNEKYFDGFLPKGVPYDKSDESSYGRFGVSSRNIIGVGVSRSQRAIGDAWSIPAHLEDKMDVQKIRISGQFDFTPYDVATASNGEGTLMGIMLHEMCHHVVSLNFSNLRSARVTKEREGSHGRTFAYYVSKVQQQLNNEGVNIKVPDAESSYVDRNTNIDIKNIIVGVPHNNKLICVIMSNNVFYKLRSDIITTYGSKGDIYVWETTDHSALDYSKTTKIPLKGGYTHSQMATLISSDKTKQLETIWND